jgi:predicted nucleotidyltransferase
VKPSEAINGKTAEIKRIIEAYGFADPRIFGSTVKQADVDGSDLDIIASITPEMEGIITLFDIYEMEADLEKLLGVSIDFNIENNMPESCRSSVLADAIRL